MNTPKNAGQVLMIKDTNPYRIRTDFDKIMENAKTYINAGGIAEWKYIIFKQMSTPSRRQKH